MEIININRIKQKKNIEWISEKVFNSWKEECILDGYYTELEYENKLYNQTGVLPVTFLLKIDNNPIGTVSIEINDLAEYNILTPWLASLYIDDKYRKKGYGSILIEEVIKYSRNKLNIDRIYLWTEKKNIEFYKNRGWEVIEVRRYIYRTIYIMKKDI